MFYKYVDFQISRSIFYPFKKKSEMLDSFVCLLRESPAENQAKVGRWTFTIYNKKEGKKNIYSYISRASLVTKRPLRNQ